MPRPRINLGERPTGWTRASFDLPKGLLHHIHEAREALPSANMKLLATAAFGLFLGLSPEVREAIYRWAHSHELEPDKMNPAEAGMLLTAMIGTLLRDAPPTEGPGSEKAGPRSGVVKKETGPRTFELHYPPVQRGGMVEKIVKTFEVVEPTEAADTHRRKAEGG